jgi:DNA-binding NarL/FixJ family response regulator
MNVLPQASKIRVLVVDDHAMIRVGLTDLFSTLTDIEIIGHANDGAQAIEMADRHRPDVVLMDMSMPVLDGVGATKAIKAKHGAAIHVLVLTISDDQELISRALMAGASGYLLKDVEPAVLISGVRSVVSGGIPLSPAIAAKLLQGQMAPAGTPGGLTGREEEILLLMAQGMANKQIARALGISDKTVKTYCARIFRRIGVHDRTQAALWATRNLQTQIPA